MAVPDLNPEVSCSRSLWRVRQLVRSRGQALGVKTMRETEDKTSDNMGKIIIQLKSKQNH